MRRLAALLAVPLLVAACGYQPRLYGGGDPADAAVPGSVVLVVYGASCERTCRITYTDGEDRQRVVEATGGWQERVRMRSAARGSVMLVVQPTDDLGRVRRASIDIDGRRAARGEGGEGTAVTLTADLPG